MSNLLPLSQQIFHYNNDAKGSAYDERVDTEDLEDIVMDLVDRLLNAGRLFPWYNNLEEGMAFLVRLRSPKLPAVLTRVIGFHRQYAAEVMRLLDKVGWSVRPDVITGQGILLPVIRTHDAHVSTTQISRMSWAALGTPYSTVCLTTLQNCVKSSSS